MESGTAACGPLRPHVERLNRKYNLGLYVSVQDARALADDDFDLQYAIIEQLHLHSRKGARRLQSVLDRFDHKARERSAQCVVNRPTAQHANLPELSRGSSSPPQAATPEDQAALQLLLLNVLEEPPRDRTQRRSRAGPRTTRAALEPEDGNGEPSSSTTAPGTRRHRAGRKKEDAHGKGKAPAEDPPQRWLYADLQRLLDTTEQTAPSRSSAGGRRTARGHDRNSELLPGVDAGPSRYRDENSAVSEAQGTQESSPFGTQEPQEWDDSFWTNEAAPPSSSPAASSSSAMYSAMEAPVLDPANGQTASDDDVFGPAAVTYPRLRRALSVESFGISEAGEQALVESFGMYENAIQQSEPGSPTETNYSSIPDIQDLRLSDDEDEENFQDSLEDGAGHITGLDATLVPGLQDRLDSVFPCTPPWLEQAPFPIIWEMTRIAMHCGVDLREVEWTDSLDWTSQDDFRNALSRHPCFAGKLFPELASQLAWNLAMTPKAPDSPGAQKRISHFLADLSYNMRSSGPLYFLKLRPLAVGLPHRLGRHFGSDRFLEITMPSHDSGHGCVPRILWNHAAAVQQVNRWLTRRRHGFLGRHWAAFFIKDADGKKAPKVKDDGPAGTAAATPQLKRMFFFAEKGCSIPPLSSQRDGTNGPAPAMKRHTMLNWLLEFDKHPQNRRQPFLKLFSRIALGLSTTTPTIVFEPHQIRHQQEDIRSPAGNVMNDGIGRMSLSVVRKLRSILELPDLPTALQGRLGCAKGMWILDPEDDGRDDWIETYPSQRKWACTFADKDHRTLEICKIAAEVRSASLNSQFITVLEAQAPDKARLRRDLGNMLEGHLRRDLDVQRKALGHPMLLAAWVHETVDSQKGRVLEGQVPFLAGLPDSDAETIAFLLSGGFDPRRQAFLWEMVYKMQKARLETLKEKLNMPVGRSTYLYMAVDFLGVLEEGEVQVCFSTKFQAEEDAAPDSDGDNGWFSDTLLVNRDVLVARSPAHYTSDIQKVRAVYRPELGSVKDVVFFSRKGKSPLAEMLSGGDYDGDMAWVCWDPRLVNNFVNAPEPSKLDLIGAGYMRQNKTTLQDLVEESSSRGTMGSAVVPSGAIDELIERSFDFNMPRGLLGRLTKYKEDLCYLRDSVGDMTATILSTVLSQLVDRAKQGIEFTEADFARLRRECLQGARGRRGPPPDNLPMPAYQGNTWDAAARAKGHILDYLKFEVIRPVIGRELRALATASDESEAEGGRIERGCSWDPDLAEPARAFEALAAKSDECFVLFEALKSDLTALFARCATFTSHNTANRRLSGLAGRDNDEDGGAGGYRDRILQQYQEWCSILPRYPEPAAPARDRDPVTTPQKARDSPAAKATPIRGTPARGTPAKRRMAALMDRYAETGTAADKTVGELLRQAYLVDAEGSQWARLRASQAFRMFYRHNYKTLWRLAGRQLQMIKGLMGGSGGGGSGGDYGPGGGSERNGGLAGAKVLMTPLAYAAMRPNKKIIQQMAARLGGTGVEGVDFDGPGGVDDA